MRYQHRYGFGGEPVGSRRWGFIAAIIITGKKIIFAFNSRITRIRELASWLN